MEEKEKKQSNIDSLVQTARFPDPIDSYNKPCSMKESISGLLRLLAKQRKEQDQKVNKLKSLKNGNTKEDFITVKDVQHAHSSE